MTNEQISEVAKILGVSEDSISAMDDEIKGGMQSVLENAVLSANVFSR